MGVLRQVAEYLYIKKHDPKTDKSRSIKVMHGINRLSLFMFIFAVIVMILKLFVFKKH